MLKKQTGYFKWMGVVVSFSCLMATTAQLIAYSEEDFDYYEGKPYMQGEWIVKFRDNQDCLSALSGSPVKTFATGAQLFRGMDIKGPPKTLSDCVKYFEPNYIIRANAIPQNPDIHPEQWGLYKINVASGDFYGSNVVAVLDTGVDYNHPDLKANMWINTGEIPNNGIDDDDNGKIDDYHGYNFVADNGDPNDDSQTGHGTHCAGTIAAVGNDGIGIVGINPSAKIMALKILDNSGFGTSASAIEAIDYAVKMGVKISNNSWGNMPFTEALRDAIKNAEENGHLFIAAAGNDSKDTDRSPNYPSSHTLNNIITVAATNKEDGLSWNSNFGATSVDVGAPGKDIYSTIPTRMGSYGLRSGTSMAAPHVTGLAALLWLAKPSWTYREVKEEILSSVDVLSDLQGKTVTGGRINASFSDICNVPLVARIKTDVKEGNAPLTVFPSGRASSGCIRKYEWVASLTENICCRSECSGVIFEDDKPLKDQEVSYSFKSPGVYKISLKVTGGNGETVTTDQEITVNGPSCITTKTTVDTANYQVPFDCAGFYVANVILASGQEGMWGLGVNPSSGVNFGGFNGGAILKENRGLPAYITFSLLKEEAIKITPFEYTEQVGLLTVKVEKQDTETLERTTVFVRNTPPKIQLTTDTLVPGFYVVTVYSQKNDPEGISGISINAENMSAGVNVGGWLNTTGVGFAAFSVAEPQTVSIVLLSGKNYGEAGLKGLLSLEFFYQSGEYNRELYWSNLDNEIKPIECKE